MNRCQKPLRASKEEYREVENAKTLIPLICFSYCLCKPPPPPHRLYIFISSENNNKCVYETQASQPKQG